MSDIDDRLANSEMHIAEMERQANALQHAALFRPSAVSDDDVRLARQLLKAWKTLRASVVRHPEFTERARDAALKNATGRASSRTIGI